MKKILLSLLLATISIGAWAADGDEFTAQTVEGIQMTFKVISEADKTCQVGDNEKTAINQNTSGEITIPTETNGYKVVAIASSAFKECRQLTKVTIPEGITSIGEQGLYYSTGLTEIHLPSTITSLGYVALAGCGSSATSITVAEGNPVFSSPNGCNAVIKNKTTLVVGCRNTIIPESVTEIDVCAFSDCASLTNIELPKGLRIINGWAFAGCSNLNNIKIPENVYYIGSMAFEYCSSLTTINLPSQLTTINNHAFLDCTNIETIYCFIKKPIKVGERAFQHYNRDTGEYEMLPATLYVPYGTKNLYETAEDWSNFRNIVEMENVEIAVSLINNGDMEGNDVSSYFVKIHAGEVVPATITNGVGVNGSRGIKVEATAMEEEAWDNQFWFRLNQPVSDGTKFRISYDYRADKEGRVQTESHEEPGTFIAMTYHGDSYDDRRYFSPEWQHFSYEGTMSSMNSSDQHPMQSVAFSLNHFEEANNYYFDNIVFEVYMDDQCPKPTFKQIENDVTIQSPFDATIYYTLDGSEPTTDSQHFAGTLELRLSQSITIKAIAIVEGYETSPVATYAFEPTTNNLEQMKEELIDMIYQLMQEADICYKELGMKDPDRTSYLWKDLDAIEYEIADVRDRVEVATTEEELDECKDRINQIAYELNRLRKEIDMYTPAYVSFDGLTAQVSGGASLDEAFREVGGREVAAQTIAAIIWGNTTPLTTDMLQGINNPNLLLYVNEASLAPQGIQNVVINGQAKEIILTDATSGNNNFFCPQAFRAEKISYTRNFRQSTQIGVSRGWEGIALPFNVQTITHETKGAITPFGSGNGKHFWLRAYDGENLYSAHEMEAYAPYVIAMPNSTDYYADYNLNGRVTFSATNTEVYETPDFSFLENEPNMPLMTIPVFQRKAQSDSIYAINVGQARGNYAEGSVFERGLREVRPFEVYTVHHGQGARPRYIPITSQGNEPTGIETLEGDSTKDSWYSLDGRQMQSKPKAKGIYIKNKKKFVLK